jgi:hypothetical protein
MSESTEFSDSGQPIYRHKERKREFEFAIGDEQSIQIISDHIEKHLGTPATVFHELISDLVHIDVHIVAPTEERPFYSLITSGMSDKPMNAPEGAEELRYAELMICLPPDWPMTQEEWKQDENSFWPIQTLKFLARFPHEYDTWLCLDHTVPNGDPPEPFGETQFSCAMLGPCATVPQEFWHLKVNEEKTINFFGLYFLYREEMDLKMKKGAEALWSLLEKQQVTELLDVSRKNTAKKRFGIF